MKMQHALTNMIKQQLRTGDVLDESILKLFETLPREAFVPESMRPFAFSDLQIPLSHGQRMMTPLEEGRMLDALSLSSHETVLEVGTGSGYFSALMSKLAKLVVTVDCFSDFTEAAKLKFREHGCENIEAYTGDASSGWLEKAPYDVVVFTAPIPMITETHRLQVVPGGRLLAICGRKPAMQCVIAHFSHEGQWTEEVLFDTCLPPIVSNTKPDTFRF